MFETQSLGPPERPGVGRTTLSRPVEGSCEKDPTVAGPYRIPKGPVTRSTQLG